VVVILSTWFLVSKGGGGLLYKLHSLLTHERGIILVGFKLFGGLSPEETGEKNKTISGMVQ